MTQRSERNVKAAGFRFSGMRNKERLEEFPEKGDFENRETVAWQIFKVNNRRLDGPPPAK